jgi:hypothetical protein
MIRGMALQGTIRKINWFHQWGEIQGDDGSARRFETRKHGEMDAVR